MVTKAEVSVDIYNLYWYQDRNPENFKRLCELIEEYCNAD